MFKNRATFRSRILSVAVISALGVTGAAVAASAVQRPAAQFGVLTRATTLNRGDVVKSAVPLTKQVHLTVTLKLRDEAGMKAFLVRPAASRGVMSQAQLANHLPTQAQAQAVANYLKSAGFTDVKISANRMLVKATGSAATVQTAFKTSLVSVHTNDGRNAFANSAAIQIPVALRGTVQAVLGLQTVHKAHIFAPQTDA